MDMKILIGATYILTSAFTWEKKEEALTCYNEDVKYPHSRSIEGIKIFYCRGNQVGLNLWKLFKLS